MKHLMLSGLMLAAAATASHNAHSSALIERDDARRIIKVIARIVYSGPALTNEIAQASTDEIASMWSETPTEVSLRGVPYKVEFEIDHLIANRQPLVNSDSCAYNFIRVLNKTHAGDRSYYEGLGSRNGVFYTSDGLGTSTTAAHEFGHGLMLDHNDFDQRSAEVPGIMFARGTLVRSEFQWDPRARAGEAGGTINPKYRKVRAEDIKAIPFSAVRNKAFKVIGCLGDGKARAIK